MLLLFLCASDQAIMGKFAWLVLYLHLFVPLVRVSIFFFSLFFHHWCKFSISDHSPAGTYHMTAVVKMFLFRQQTPTINS